MSATTMAMVGDFPQRHCGRKVCHCDGSCLKPVSFDPFTAPWKYQINPWISYPTRPATTVDITTTFRFKSTVPALRPEDV